ncbi:MAG: ABC transporter permease [Verrucomicrobia bacterium]|nr:MAG: ABC transporter permease [Verrucomicrobiota bacterium]
MRRLAQSFLAVAFGLALGLSATWIAGENPWEVLKILARGAFGSRENIGMTLFYTTPLIFTGLSVAVAFQAGLFNVGAEGQLNLGALAAAAIGALLPGLGWPMAPLLASLAALAAGTVWGAIPGWLRARRGSHEVIVTIMLNFVAVGLSTYVALYVLKNPESQNPETRPIGLAYMIPRLGVFGDAPVSAALPLALLVAAIVWVFLRRTALGYELRAVGQSEPAARAAGIDATKMRILAMAIAGGLAGLVGVAEVLGNAGKFKVEFSPQYGFIGIAVALLGRNEPIGIVAAALLFGALHQGTRELDFSTEHITSEVSLVFQGLIILAVSAEPVTNWFRSKPRINTDEL